MIYTNIDHVDGSEEQRDIVVNALVAANEQQWWHGHLVSRARRKTLALEVETNCTVRVSFGGVAL